MQQRRPRETGLAGQFRLAGNGRLILPQRGKVGFVEGFVLEQEASAAFERVAVRP